MAAWDSVLKWLGGLEIDDERAAIQKED